MSVCTVEPLEAYRVRLGFDDETIKEIDLEPYLRGPVFEAIRNSRAVFSAVRVDHEAGTIVWPNGADIDPNVLYYDDLQPAWYDDLIVESTVNAKAST